jgi:hypothetical protein
MHFSPRGGLAESVNRALRASAVRLGSRSLSSAAAPATVAAAAEVSR